MRNRWAFLFFVIGLVGFPSLGKAQTNSLVYQGPDGRLIYGSFALQGRTNSINTVPDFSTAGYKGGGEPIPFIPTVLVITNGPGDDTTLIQNAIDAVSGMSLGTNGFRGALLIKAGDYEVSDTLRITADGVVIRGEGQQASGGTHITLTANVQTNLFEVKGSGSPTAIGGSTKSITDSFVPVGARYFNVASASGYALGDKIRTQHKINDTWITTLGMDDLGGGTPWTSAEYQLYHERTITGITGTTIYVDAPFVQAVEDVFGGADVFKYTFSGQISNLGFEGLRLDSAYTNSTDESHGWIAIKFSDTRDAWVRQVTGQYFGFGVVSVNGTCHYMTIEDTAMLDAVSQTTGGRKYSFNIDDSTFVLMQRCYTRGGRHDFVSGSKTPGPNVFVDSLSEVTFSDIGPHHRYATGQLYDNLKGGEINVQNRYSYGTGHGWAGAQVMFWNCDGSTMICEAPDGAMNWSIGNDAVRTDGSLTNEPDGIWESENISISAPRSLYYAQLADRRGRDSLRDIILPEQESGPLWTSLASWAGEGLFGDPVVAWSSETAVQAPTNSTIIKGVIRDLQMLENGATSLWSQTTGPDVVSFGSTTDLVTSASFPTTGVYVLTFTASDGVRVESADLTITIGDVAPIVSLTSVDTHDATSVTINGSLDAGGPATVLFAWDSQDRGTNIGAWANTSLLSNQNIGSVSNSIGGLYYGVNYSCRLMASNAFGMSWSSETNFTTRAPSTGYVLLEDFETRTLDAAINGQGDWSGNTTGTNEFDVKIDPDNSTNQVLWFNQGAGKSVTLNSADLLISEGTTGTFYFRMRGYASETGLVLRVRPELAIAKGTTSLSDVGPETELRDFGSSDVRYTGAGSLIQSSWYRVWLVVDNASNTFNSYLKKEGSSQFQASSAAAFRNVVSNDLVSFMLYTLSGGSNGDAWFDDIYIASLGDHHLIDPLDPPVYVSIENSTPDNITSTSATINGVMTAVDSVFSVYAHVSQSNNLNAATWQTDASALTQQLGTFTNVSGLSVSNTLSSLIPGTLYYCTMSISNACGEIWAVLNQSFTTEAFDPDSDSDGLMDSWELSMFGSLSTSDGSGDQDGDAFIDLHEFLAGTDATNSSSFLYISSVKSLSSNLVEVSWPGVTGKTYEVLFRTNLLGGSWMTNANGIMGVAPWTITTNSLPASQGYFLIHLQ